MELSLRCRSTAPSSAGCSPWHAPPPPCTLAVFLAEEDLPDVMRKNIVNHMVMVHLDVTSRSALFEQQLKRYNYVTPKNYLDFISNYRGCLKESGAKLTSSSHA